MSREGVDSSQDLGHRTPPTPDASDRNAGPEPRTSGNLRTLVGLRDFRNYWYGSAIFGVGIWAFLTAMGWTALELTDSAFAVSMTNVVYFLPMFVFALPAGSLADLWDRRLTAILVRLGCGFVATVGAALAALGMLTYPALLIVSFLVGVSIIGELAARQAYIAQVVERPLVTNATALTSFQSGISRIAGPLLAGWLIDTLGDAGGYGLFAATNFLFVFFFLRIRASGKTPPSGRSMREEIRDGLVYVRSHRDAATVVLMAVLTGAVGWVYIALMPVMARDILDGDAVVLGILNMAVGLGSTVSALGLSVRRRTDGEGRLYVASLVLWGASILVFGLSRSVPVSVVALVTGGAGFGAQVILARSLLLRIVDPTFHGRVLGLLMLTWGANIIGTLAGGSLADAVGVSAVVASSGLMVAAIPLALLARNPDVVRV